MDVYIRYDIKGARNEEEKNFFESVALELYNYFTGNTSSIACGGFNRLVDTLRERGVDFKGTWKESMTDMNDPTYEELYDIFAKGCFSVKAKEKKYVREERYLQLDGIDVVSIKDNIAIISGKIMNL